MTFNTVLKQSSPQWRVPEVLLDPEGDDLWCVECEIERLPGKVTGEPLIRLRRIGT